MSLSPLHDCPWRFHLGLELEAHQTRCRSRQHLRSLPSRRRASNVPDPDSTPRSRCHNLMAPSTHGPGARHRPQLQTKPRFPVRLFFFNTQPWLKLTICFYPPQASSRPALVPSALGNRSASSDRIPHISQTRQILAGRFSRRQPRNCQGYGAATAGLQGLAPRSNANDPQQAHIHV
jgi:hypothetical protein